MRRLLQIASLTLVCMPCACSRAPASVVLATTTSVGNSGLLNVLTAEFDKAHHLRIEALLVGSGLALRMLETGQAEVVISHAPALERQYLARHPDWRYRKFMYNDFVLVGPDDDPAGVSGAATIAEAMRRIAVSATFLSRGDESGTHQRERELWQHAGATPPAERLPTSGQGMGATLRQASATGAYTLSDRATFVALAERLDLRIVFEGGADLLNTYAVIVPRAEGTASRGQILAEWLASADAQRLIADFKTGSAPPPFQPWPAGAPAGAPEDTPVPRR